MIGPLLRGAATLNGSSVPIGHETVLETGHFCQAHDLRSLGPYFALGRVLATFCAGVGLCSGPALTTLGRHAQRLVCPTWARCRVRDRPLLRWAHDLRLLGPYFALGRVLATLAPGLDPVEGRPLLRGAATLSGSSVPP